MKDLLRIIPVSDTTTPVRYVCFHPVAAAKLEQGITVNELDGEKYTPDCLAVEYEYDSVLSEICIALGWQGGTIHQVVEEIKKLQHVHRVKATMPSAAALFGIVRTVANGIRRAARLLSHWRK